MAVERDEVHEVKDTMVVEVYYPGHEKRAVSKTFKKTKKYLLVEKQATCFICGADKELEIHHYHVEWAMQNAVDWEKMKLIHPEFSWETFTKPEDFIDSPYNSMVLCEKHHRAKNHGIHAMPYPLWIMQRHVRKDFDLDASDGQFNPQ